MAVSLEEVSSSLVREYLSRKGFQRTIACMDEEHPRTEASINNRSQLRQILNIGELYRKNKVQKSPLKTLLEIIVKFHIGPKTESINSNEGITLQSGRSVSLNACSSALTPNVMMTDIKTKDRPATIVTSKHVKLRSQIQEVNPSQSVYSSFLSETNRLSSNNNETGLWSSDSEDQKGQSLEAILQDDVSLVKREPEMKPVFAETTQTRTNRIRRGMMTAPIASTPQEANKKRQNRRLDVALPVLRKEKENRHAKDGFSVTGFHHKNLESSLMKFSSADCTGDHQELWSATERDQKENCFEKVGLDKLKNQKVDSMRHVADVDLSEMVLDDIGDDENVQELSKVSLQRTVAEHRYTDNPMDQQTAMKLKVLLLGSSFNCFPAEWMNQGFTFSDKHDLAYGIVQKKGGPCGVLASIQASVLKKLLFENIKSSGTDLQRLRPSNTTRRKCLVLALAEILWRIGEEKQATIATLSGRSHFTPSGHFKSEGVLEKITCVTVDNIKDLLMFLDQHIEQFETGVLGCLLLTISAILSRSIEKLRGDMDVPTTTLIGAHGYCTQELVNLLLCGKAVPNVFDNDMELDSGMGNITLLKGIKGRCDVGLLSLFEHYNICKVGTYLKTPRFPIWVVCSESHFSVLFGLQRELLISQDKGLQFDLYYYDGLANQQEEIRLTVVVGKSSPNSKEAHTDLIPPLEHCIRTRWTDAYVDWNDTEPIL